ncbi:MAG: UDP-3-O-(3-hydroxymyristoyl)glucosamine N-acyltransferase [Verrucomicrobia bacterium]|nr:MAG: UDP-3-O-(3-hydroxymyristoyl)glucosamine N-acyltransferase [Verrucomicrobiota bacterium]
MTFTLKQLAATSGGELIGDPSLQITGAASLAEATPGEISFFGNRKYIGQLRKTRASAVFVPPDFAESIATAQIRVANPIKVFEQIVLKFAPKPITFVPGVHASAVVDPSVDLGERVSIQPYAVIEAGARIGDDTIIGAGSYIGHETVIGSACLIYPRVTIRERSRIGSRVIIHSGVVIGADGFGFEMVDGRHEKIPQLGIVQIDDDVEIGANTTVDRARFGRTWIQQGVKIDNLVQIAHNVVIGKNSVIAAQTGISGSTRVGERVMMGGQVGIVGHIEIGDNTAIGAQSGISKNISGGTWWASPAVPLAEAKRQIAWIHRLGKLFARVKEIEKKLGLHVL